jgi:hypothetical protein
MLASGILYLCVIKLSSSVFVQFIVGPGPEWIYCVNTPWKIPGEGVTISGGQRLETITSESLYPICIVLETR